MLKVVSYESRTMCGGLAEGYGRGVVRMGVCLRRRRVVNQRGPGRVLTRANGHN